MNSASRSAFPSPNSSSASGKRLPGKEFFAPGPFSLRSVLEIVALWRNRTKLRRRLAAFPDYLLDDIGLTRETADREYRTPFWRDGIF